MRLNIHTLFKKGVIIPLRLVFIGLLIFEVMSVVGVIWLSFRSRQNVVAWFSGQLREKKVKKLEHHITDVLVTAETLNERIARLIETEPLNLTTIRSFETLYWSNLALVDPINGLSVGNTEGELMQMFRQVQEGSTTYHLEYTDVETSGRSVSVELDDQRQVIRSQSFNQALDARERSWFQEVFEANTPIWTRLTNFDSTVRLAAEATPSLNFARPIVDDNQQFTGVINVFLDLEYISQLIADFSNQYSGYIYIMEPTGELIGTSDGKAIRGLKYEEDHRIRAFDCPTPIIQQSSAYLNQFFDGDLTAIRQAQQLDLFIDGEQQLLQVVPVVRDHGIHWLVVFVMPETSLMGQISANTRNTVILSVCILGVAIAIGILIANWILRPIAQLSNTALRLSQGTVDQHQQRWPRVKEFNLLAQSLNRIEQSLHLSFKALQDSEQRFQNMAINVPGVIVQYVLHPDGSDQVIYMSPGCTELWEVRAVAVVQNPQILWSMVHSDDLSRLQESIGESAATLQPWSCQWRITTPSGKEKWLEASGRPTRQTNDDVIWDTLVMDVSDRIMAEQKLRYDALHDQLTGLSNRNLLLERLSFALKRLKRNQSAQFAVLFLDLDHFKVVNDSLGHLIGDQLLLAVARELTTFIRETDLAARLGGDEFVILLEDIHSIDEVVQVAERILAAFGVPFQLAERDVFTSASIGIVMGTDYHHQSETLLRDADLAMYQAKQEGRRQYAIFDPAMHLKAVERLQLEQDLRQALVAKELTLYYQPIINFDTETIRGVEALVRWQHPQRGLLQPNAFIQLAEETGLIVPMGQWILETACQQLMDWQAQFPLQTFKMSVNLSVQQLQPSLVPLLQEMLCNYQVPSNSLILEITESMLIQNNEVTQTVLEQIRAIGIQLSIDDFGTGYSSLSYLNQLPVNALKIDRSFVTLFESDKRHRGIVESIIALTNVLGLEVIAEGIESTQQLEWLKGLGCKLGQGYLFSPPMSATDITEALSSPGIRY